jgi:adenylate cyclase
MGGILIFFIILGTIGILVTLNGNDFPVLRGLISIVIFGLFTAVHEILIFPKLKKFSFWTIFSSSLFYYYFTFSTLVVLMGYATLVYKNGITWSHAFQLDYSIVFPMGIGLPLYLLFLGVSLLNVLRFTNVMIGRAIVPKYYSGRYHRPRSEERVFMFLDLKSSTAIAERLGHQLYSNFLKDFFNKLDEAILETKANLYQYVGDEIVMIWNFKNGFENNNCIKFYSMVKDIIHNSQKEFIDKYGIVPEYKAGIHCGTVSITEIGSLRKSIAYHGDPINTASRVCAKCKELDEDILISEDVYSHVDSKFNNSFNSIGEFFLKGKKNKLGLYSVS